MRADIRKIVNMLVTGVETALRSASDEEYVEAMEELYSTFEASADAKREEMRAAEDEEG